MPELPEVECARRLLEAQCVGKKITYVNAVEDEKVFENATSTEVSAALLNKVPISAGRLGKHCWLDFGPSAPALLLHLGMTGGTVVRGKGSAHFQRYSISDSQWPPKYLKLELQFEDGTQWAFCDSRRFARIRLISDPLSVPPLSLLGWDPLLSWPTLEEFSTKLSTQRRAIKALLLDQSFSAGVGNWVADEVLYQCKIHPEQPANSLGAEHAQQLHRWIQEVCRVAAEVDADADRLPGTWLFHHRWGKGNAEKSKIDGHAIDHITVGGRTSAYVPALQKLSKVAGVGSKKKEAGGSKKKEIGKKVAVKRQLPAEGGAEKVEGVKKKLDTVGKATKQSAKVVEVDVGEAVVEGTPVEVQVQPSIAPSERGVRRQQRATTTASAAIVEESAKKTAQTKALQKPVPVRPSARKGPPQGRYTAKLAKKGESTLRKL